jgi:DNA-binding MarR family transcriptional regulator
LFHHTVAARVGVSPSDLRCLSLVDALGPMTPGELATATGLTAAAITSVIDRLEREGFARRHRDEEDRRRVLVVATPAARRRVGRYFISFHAAWQDVLEEFSDDELEVVQRFLDRTTDLMRNETGKLRE